LQSGLMAVKSVVKLEVAVAGWMEADELAVGDTFVITLEMVDV
jgi:hypothetical protein